MYINSRGFEILKFVVHFCAFYCSMNSVLIEISEGSFVKLAMYCSSVSVMGFVFRAAISP